MKTSDLPRQARDKHEAHKRRFFPLGVHVCSIMTSDHVDRSSSEDLLLSPPRLGWAGSVDLQNVTIRNVQGDIGARHVCGTPRHKGEAPPMCPRAVGRFQGNAAFPVGGVRLEHIHVTGFNATQGFPVPCTFSNVTGSGVDVQPAGCVPPAAE